MKGAKLGINGLGRIGKLSIWQHIGRKSFSEIVVNIGRPVGTSLEDVARFIEKDSTYGTMHNYLYGYKSQRLIENLDEKSGSMVIDGIPVTILREVRNPKDIPWKSKGVDVVVESTGQFIDPTQPADAQGGAARGHLAAGARKVVQLAVSIASHSPLMEPITEAFAAAVDAAPIVDAAIPLVANVSAMPITRADDIRAELKAQLTSPVRWTESMRTLVAQDVTRVVEIGPKNVLTGLMRRIERKVERLNLGDAPIG